MSAVVEEITLAVLVRGPASPPGRTLTVKTGQVEPLTQTGSVAIEQLSCTLLPPLAALEQLTPLARFGTNDAEMNPDPVGPVSEFIRLVRLSVKLTLVAADVPELRTSMLKVSTSPAARLATLAVFATEISAELAGVLPLTSYVIVLFGKFVSGRFEFGEPTVKLLLMLPALVAVVVNVTVGDVAPAASGAPAV